MLSFDEYYSNGGPYHMMSIPMCVQLHMKV